MRILDWNPTPIHEIPYLVAQQGGGATERRTLAITLARTADLPPPLDGLVFTADLQGRELLSPTSRQCRPHRRPRLAHLEQGPELLPPTNRQYEPSVRGYREGRRLLGEVVAKQLRRLCDQGDLPAADKLGIVLAGDFWAEPGCMRRGGLGKVGPVWSAFGRTSRWVAGVLGNHDQDAGPRLDERRASSVRRLALLDGDTVELDGCRLGGVSGIIGNPCMPRRKSEQQYLELLEKVLLEQPDILILHESPQGPEGECRGKTSIQECLLRLPPTLVVCGHCPWPTPLQSLSNGTQICNVNSRVIVMRR
jgi:Icc protein